MWAQLISILMASLLGSVHCAGMCGPFVAFYSGAAALDLPHSTLVKALTHAAYHIGRLCTYCFLGVLACASGALLDTVALKQDIHGLSAFISLVIISVWGVTSFIKYMGWKSILPALRIPIHSNVIALFKKMRGHSPITRALLVGACTTFLPCAPLYTFVALAAGTGHIAQSLLFMFVFWLGTLPMLLTIGTTFHLFTYRARQMLPILSILFLIIASVIGLFQRVDFSHSPSASCHASSENSVP